MTNPVSPILRVVSVPDAFMFFEDSEQYTGEFAVSLADLSEKLGKVPAKSIEFHFKRRDFEEWVGRILGDKELAKRIIHIDNRLQGEELRKALREVIQKRLGELRETTQNVNGLDC